MSDARTKLRSAIADFNTVTRKIESLESATARANEAVELAKGEVATHAGLEKEITRWRVAQVKNGASTKKLPENLAAKVDEKKSAESEVAQAEATFEAMREELRQLRKSLKPAEEARQNAAVDVLLRENVDDLAQEYSEVSLRAKELGLLLHGIAHLQVEKGGKLVDVGYTQSMVNALRAGDGFPAEVSPMADMGTRWGKRLKTLFENPDAEITRPRVVVPSDYVRTNGPTEAHFGFPLPATYSVRHPVD
jgi:hypothetical protein